MARSVAAAVAAARPVRAASGVGNATSLGKVVGVPGSPQVPQVSQKGGANRGTSLNPLTKRVAGGGAPSASAAAAPTRDSAAPWDAQAESEAGEAETAFNTKEAELAGNWTAREGYYGFGANGANNPYSQASLLATHHEWNERGVLNGAGNQLYAGSTVNAHRQETGRYTTSYGQLLQAYEDEKAAKEREETAAGSAYETALKNAGLGAIGRASATEPEPVAAGGGGGGGASRGSAPAKQGGGVTKKKTRDGKIGIGGARKA
jgi:hypothetical protein